MPGLPAARMIKRMLAAFSITPYRYAGRECTATKRNPCRVSSRCRFSWDLMSWHVKPNPYRLESDTTSLPDRCVIVREGLVIARGHNMTNATRNVSERCDAGGIS